MHYKKIISITKLSKSYNQNNVLQEINLEIPSGSCFALLGINGAGKTTLINILSGLIPPDSGRILWKGEDVDLGSKKHKMRVGVVPQEISLYEKLSAMDNLRFWGSLYDIKGQDLDKRAKILLDDLNLSDTAGKKVGEFSGGMKRRLNIACGLIHKPELLFLDEPTVGADPQSRNFIYSLIEKVKNEKTSIIYTTHYLEEVERLCSKVAILHKGRIMKETTVDNLQQQLIDNESLEIVLKKSMLNFKDIKASIRNLISMENNKLIIGGGNFRKELPLIIGKIQSLGGIILSIDIKKGNFETIFLELTKEK